MGGDRTLCHNLQISASLDRPLFLNYEISVNRKCPVLDIPEKATLLLTHTAMLGHIRSIYTSLSTTFLTTTLC